MESNAQRGSRRAWMRRLDACRERFPWLFGSSIPSIARWPDCAKTEKPDCTKVDDPETTPRCRIEGERDRRSRKSASTGFGAARDRQASRWYHFELGKIVRIGWSPADQKAVVGKQRTDSAENGAFQSLNLKPFGSRILTKRGRQSHELGCILTGVE